MSAPFEVGNTVYFVPANKIYWPREMTITRVGAALLTLNGVIGCSKHATSRGFLCRDYLGSYWVSREAWDAHQERAARPFKRRVREWFTNVAA